MPRVAASRGSRAGTRDRLRRPIAVSSPIVSDIDRVAEMLRNARHVVVLTGAGISTESGIRDFRGPNGLWTKDPSAEKTAQLEYYMGDPEVRRRAWQNRIKGNYFTAEPNAAHHALVDLEKKGALHCLVTQNVDGLHHAAGQSPEIVVEIHGNVREVKCMTCAWGGPMEATLDRVRAGEDDPACVECGGILKSATISFGENLVADDLVRAQEHALRADVFLALGTSLGVYPAAALPEIAVRQGAALVVANAEPTPFDPVADVVSRDQLGEFLPAVAAELLAIGNSRPAE
jgi:NAD-dependent deacetylase